MHLLKRASTAKLSLYYNFKLIIMKSKKNSSSIISAWEQDPGLGSQPDGGQLIQIEAPELNSTSLPTSIQNPSTPPVAKIYSAGTPEFRYWATAACLSRASTYWSSQLPGVSWQVGHVLPVDLYYGRDLNAYYDRVGLRFFQDNVGTRTVYSCESPDIVCHEQGHAVLDSIKPQLWNAASIEVAAFHESFGDMSALLCALQIPSLRHAVLAETNNVLYKSSRLSRLAEQLGWAIRQSYPSAVDTDCLRNAVNQFFYRDPNTLPSSAPANSLSSEPHSFSRVFTSAFFEGLANMFKTMPAQDEPNLLQISIDMGKILVGGIKAASVVSTFYSQVAVNMLTVASSDFSGAAYTQALKSAFIKHGIISPASSAAISNTKASKGMTATAVQPQEELPKLSLTVSEYSLGADTIMVHSANEPKSFNITGAALDFGSVEPPSEDITAKSFLEDLLRRGRLKTEAGKDHDSQKLNIASSAGTPIPTHELRKEGDHLVLKRLRIDCGLNHQHR